MSAYLGLDTSNYTTSVAVYRDGVITQNKLLLPVKHGNCGLRQSDAVFHHVRQLPLVTKQLLEDNTFDAIGVSFAPRRAEGSYMPCFLAGLGAAEMLSNALNIPLYRFSHQEGHIAAALYSCDKLDLIGKPFLAFHVSGGTTEALLVSPSDDNPFSCKLLASSLDLHVGQAIDRVGVMLGLGFPCGPELEKLALNYNGEKLRVKPALKGMDFCLSGIENQAKKLYDNGESKEKIATICIEYILQSFDKCTEKILEQYPSLPIIYSGGVMSNSIIRKYFTNKYNAFFAEPCFSSDNAAGIAVLTQISHKSLK
ncbi:MAG: peptidase M22 [Clostridia bacterium]|nr:peptidase M22 [Clostridia bacterium]